MKMLPIEMLPTEIIRHGYGINQAKRHYILVAKQSMHCCSSYI